MQARYLIVISCLLMLPCLCQGQFREHFNFGGGAGFTMPTGRAGDSLNTGWNINLRGGYNINSHFAADLDFLYTRSGLNSAALAALKEPGGNVGTWSLSFNPVVHVTGPKSRVQPYVTAGFGLFHANLTLTQPGIAPGIICDPYFGFCYPTAVGVNVVVASNSTWKAGFNAGGGLDIRVGDRLKIFAESRYFRRFTTYGEDFTYVPVTFGVHW